MAHDVKSILAAIPNVDVTEAFEELSRKDPALWCMYKRRLRGYPYVFDVEKQLRAMKPDDKNMMQMLLRHRPFLVKPLRDLHPHKVYEKARQIGVSELSISESLWFLDSHEKVKCVYCFPRDKQLTDFSTTRIGEAFDETPRMRRVIGTPNQVTMKQIGPRGSYLLLRSAWESNLGEGIDADVVVFDEKDRMKEGVEVAFRESLKSSKWGLLREVSTPTLPGRGVDASYRKSDQQEWHVRCEKCGTWQTVDWPDNIVQMMDIPVGATENDIPEGAYEFLCRRATCRGKLDRLHGQWIAKYPSRSDVRGYWMPQTIAPWITATRLMKNRIQYKFQQLWTNYSSLPGSRVLVRNTARRIEDVRVGDVVLTHEGRWSAVTELTPHPYTGIIVDVYVGSDQTPTCSVTAHHPFLVQGGTWLYAENLMPVRRGEPLGHRLCFPKPKITGQQVTLDVAALCGVPVTLDGDRVRCSSRMSVPAEIVVDDAWAYFFGLFLAEGNIQALTTVHHRKEKKLIEFARRMWRRLGMHANGQDPSKYTGQAQNAVVTGNGGSKILRGLFKALYCGTLADKQLPEFVFQLDRERRLSFLKGYVHGDGCTSGGVLELVTCSPHIATSLQYLIASLGYYAKVREGQSVLHDKSFTKYRLTYSGAPGRRLLRELGHAVDAPPRSYAFYEEDEDYFYLPVRKLVRREVKDTQVYNFGVSGDESYILNGVVSHNCLGKTSTGENVLITEDDFRNCIAGHKRVQRRDEDWERVFVGIDWGHLNWVVVLGINYSNQRTYLLNLGVFQDDDKRELDSVKHIDAFIAPYDPDVIVADGGYGKDRNTYLLRKYPGKLYACLDEHTKVATLDVKGWKYIKDMQVGDAVYAWDGKKLAPTRVTKVHDNGRRSTVKVTMCDGNGRLKEIICTPDHVFPLRLGGEKRADALQAGDRLVPFGRWRTKGGRYRAVNLTNTSGDLHYEHRVVLPGHKFVHHLNHDGLDNRPENLHGCSSAKAHRDVHPIKMPASWVAALKKRNKERPTIAAVRTPKARAKAVKTRQERGWLKKDRLENHVVVSVTPCGTSHVWDLTVEHAAHNFALADSVFVHNCWYNPSDKASRSFQPSWQEGSAKVLIDRTVTLKNAARAIKEVEVGLPEPDQMLGLFIKHMLNLAPMRVEEDGEIYETIDKVGDDHLAHAFGYALIGQEKFKNSLSNFSVVGGWDVA